MSNTTYVPTPQIPAGIVGSLNGGAYVYLVPTANAVVHYDANLNLIASVGRSYGYFTPLTGTTIVLSSPINIVNPAGTIAALTIDLPASPIAGQMVTVSFTHIVTALTVATTDGSTITGTAVTAAAVGTTFSYIYDSNTNSWIPIV
jgi:hypothetical protein